jgi:predicted RNA-binding Zn-ribbon protein involved in translation (DUF1610 family)
MNREPEYQRRCMYCGDVVEENEQCCGEVHNEMEAECPECGNEIKWQSATTSCGVEASIPRCTHCEWEGDPQ